jgi:hypothetical protein
MPDLGQSIYFAGVNDDDIRSEEFTDIKREIPILVIYKL